MKLRCTDAKSTSKVLNQLSSVQVCIPVCSTDKPLHWKCIINYEWN